MSLHSKLAHVLGCLVVATALGCKKQQQAEESAAAPAAPAEAAAAPAAAPAAPAAGHEKFPGENDIRAALARKEYKNAIDKWVAAKGFIASPEQQDAYESIFIEMRSELMDASNTDAKAAEALMTLRAMRSGR